MLRDLEKKMPTCQYKTGKQVYQSECSKVAVVVVPAN